MSEKSSPEFLFDKSKKLVPGGVHSPVRSFKGLDMAPRFIERAEGAMIYDTQGKDYIDFCMSFGPLILGHKNPKVAETLKSGLDKGWSFGACEPYSLELAEFLLEKLTFGEQIRFVNSGTEAVMTALRLVRGVTGRDKIIKFNGCYHGHVDSMLIKAGSGLAGTAEASSKGVPAGVADDTLIVELGDKAQLEKCFQDHPGQIAAVIIEPLPANNGLLVQSKDFLKFVRELTSKHNTLLIFDEVISGFRVALGGMVEKTGITPDVVTYGKIIGGGLPVGAVCATKELMQHLAPVGDIYQAGTLSANPLAMLGGLATLKELTKEAYAQIERNTDTIVSIFKKWLAEYDGGRFSDLTIIHSSSLFWIVPGDGNIHEVNQIPQNLAVRFGELFPLLLSKGIYLSPNAYEVGFCSLAHGENIATELQRRLWE